MSGYTIISIDAMGGDHGPSVTVPAALQALRRYPQLKVILVGQEPALSPYLRSTADVKDRLTIQTASQVVAMDELPSLALRGKKDSSMRVAINLVKSQEAHACVSAGNTGALMVTARFVLKTLAGVDRPAIVSSFPTKIPQKIVRILDLGANVDSEAQHLVQFAVMGSVLSAALDNIPSPKVYLLNIGEEEIKGNEQVKETARILSASQIVNYQGYIEGDHLYAGTADVIVCDGFVGNVALKVTEGVARFIANMLKQAFYQNIFTKMVGAIVKPILKKMMQRIDPQQYNGAALLGLQGIVVKSHGSATTLGFERAIEEAMLLVQTNVQDRIRSEIERILTA